MEKDSRRIVHFCSVNSGDAAVAGRRRRRPQSGRRQPPVPARPALEPATGVAGLRQDLQGGAEEGGQDTQVRITYFFVLRVL